jgi:hypothetical protein
MISGHPYYEEYVVMNYSTDQKGRDIKDEDIVRPLNHRYSLFGSNETHSWRRLSTAAAPTYGTCVECMRAGPLAQVCNECNSHTAVYMILVSELFDDSIIQNTYVEPVPITNINKLK